MVNDDKAQFTTDESDNLSVSAAINVFEEIPYNLEEAKIEDAGGVPVLVNPSRDEMIGAVLRSAQHQLRVIVTKDGAGDVYCWDAHKAVHCSIMSEGR